MKDMGVLTAKKVGRRLRKSDSWVYDHAPDLGGVKIGGSWVFTEEGLSDALQRAGEVARQRHGGQAAKQQAVHQKGRSKEVGARRKKEAEKFWNTNPAEHGIEHFLFSLLRSCETEEVLHKNVPGEAEFGSEDM